MASPMPIATPTSPTLEIVSYTPDSGYAKENTKVIIVLKGVNLKEHGTYSCNFEGQEIQANVWFLTYK
jgi:hypothetical protein